ncbi:hypothetical protein QBC37DRAFT_463506, partial [Rhypophila decipiens]
NHHKECPSFPNPSPPLLPLHSLRHQEHRQTSRGTEPLLARHNHRVVNRLPASYKEAVTLCKNGSGSSISSVVRPTGPSFRPLVLVLVQVTPSTPIHHGPTAKMRDSVTWGYKNFRLLPVCCYLLLTFLPSFLNSALPDSHLAPLALTTLRLQPAQLLSRIYYMDLSPTLTSRPWTFLQRLTLASRMMHLPGLSWVYQCSTHRPISPAQLSTTVPHLRPPLLPA